jgi:hypothetical protein
MKTNFKNKTFLVLTTGNDRSIAIVECEKELCNIKGKLKKALLEDYDATKIVFHTKTTIIEVGIITIFKVKIERNLFFFEEYFKLKSLPIYKKKYPIRVGEGIFKI